MCEVGRRGTRSRRGCRGGREGACTCRGGRGRGGGHAGAAGTCTHRGVVIRRMGLPSSPMPPPPPPPDWRRSSRARAAADLPPGGPSVTMSLSSVACSSHTCGEAQREGSVRYQRTQACTRHAPFVPTHTHPLTPTHLPAYEKGAPALQRQPARVRGAAVGVPRDVPAVGVAKKQAPNVGVAAQLHNRHAQHPPLGLAYFLGVGGGGA